MKKFMVLFIVLAVILLAPMALRAQTGSPAQLVTVPKLDVQPAVEMGSGQPFQWSHSGGGLTELHSVLAPAPDHKISLWSHSGGGLTELTAVHTMVTAVSE